MRKFSQIISVALLAMSFVEIAHAYQNKLTGFYAGLTAGPNFNNVQLKSNQLGFTLPTETCNVCSNYATFTPGVQVGYLQRVHNDYVAGVEANINYNATQANKLGCESIINSFVNDGFTFVNRMQVSAKARVGHMMNWRRSIFIPYFTAGVSFADAELSYRNEGNDYYTNNTLSAGWLVGAGVELPFHSHWSMRAEYNYVDYHNVITLNLPSVYGLIDFNGKGRIDLNSNNIFVALNYWI